MSDLDDPDDAYDGTDPVPVRLVNLDRRLRFIAEHLELEPPAVMLARVGRLRVDLATIARELFP